MPAKSTASGNGFVSLALTTSACQMADLDGDLSVGFNDLSLLVGEWGACF